MLIISSREFRDHQKKYFDLVDENKEQVIIQRGKNKAYKLTPVEDGDLYFTPELLKKIKHSMEEIESGNSIKLQSKEDIEKLFSL